MMGNRRVRGIFAVVLALACFAACASAAAADVTAQDFTDWTAISGTPAVATGALHGQGVSLSGTHVFPVPVSRLDGTWPAFAGPDFSPPLASTDVIQIGATIATQSYTLSFGAPVTDPELEIGSLGSRIDFQAGTVINRISGQPGLTVSGSTITGAPNVTLGPDGVNDSNGSVRLIGTFTSISFTTNFSGSTEDGILLQVGAAAPPSPPTTTTSTTTTTTPPPPSSSAPVVRSLSLLGTPTAGRQVLLNASLSGPAQKLLWSVRGTTLIGLAAQTFMRFRPPPGPTTVAVRAITSAGVIGPARTRTIFGPPLPTSGLAGRIGALVAKGPSAVAIGPSTLGGVKTLTRLGCAAFPTTVMAGGLQVRGCLLPVQSLSDIPAAERGIIENLATQLHIGTDVQSIDTAISLTDAYKSNGPVEINGVTLTPQNGAAIVIYPQANAIASANASLSVGGLKLGAPQRFLIGTRPRFGGVNLGTFARLPGGLGDIGGLSFAGDVSVNLSAGGASITASLQLPDFLKLGGVDFQGRVTLHASNDQGLVVDNATIGPINADLGALSVQQLKISYNRAANEWRGQGRACVLGDACLDMIPPNGSVVIRNGELSFAGASLGFPPPGIQLFPGVSLERIGFGVGLNPTRFTGNARVNVLQILAIDGRLVLAFPSARQPYMLDRNEVGGGFPASFYARAFTTATFGISADEFLEVPVLGNVKLGSGYFLYNYPDYLAFGGAVHDSFFDVISIDGSLDGAFKLGTGQFRLGGHVRGCVIGVICRGATGVISSHGVGACLDVGPLSIGGGVVYRPFEVKLWLLDGCKWSRFDEISLRAADAAVAHVIRIRRGEPSQMIQLAGSTAAPEVRVTGPGGQSLQTPAGSGFVHAGAIRILHSAQLRLTGIGFQNARPGLYTIQPLPASAPITSFGQASDPPDARVTASVRGTGTERVLAYDVRRRPNQRVTFTELGSGGGSRTIGTVAGGGRGQLHFSPAPGRDARRIVAQFELAGLPAETLTVARFTPPPPQLATPRGLSVRHIGSAVRVRWSPVPGAATYEVLTTPTDGSEHTLRTHGLHLTIRAVAAFSSGSVSVRALAPLRDGRAAVAHFRATRTRPTSLRPLPHCSGTAKLVCRSQH